MIFTLIAVLKDVVSWRNSLYVEPLSVLSPVSLQLLMLMTKHSSQSICLKINLHFNGKSFVSNRCFL